MVTEMATSFNLLFLKTSRHRHNHHHHHHRRPQTVCQSESDGFMEEEEGRWMMER